jgi:hypothetical protein
MKKSYVILSLLLAMIVVYATVPVLARINLLENPGFETGDFPPWDFDGDDEWDADIDGPGHTGNYYAWITMGFGDAWIWQEIDPPRCAMYLEFWYRGDVQGVIKVWIYYSDGSEQVEILDAADEWTHVHIDLVTIKLVKAVEIYAIYFGYVDVDGFDLEACETVVSGELLPNNVPTIGTMIIAVISTVAISMGFAFKRRRPI